MHSTDDRAGPPGSRPLTVLVTAALTAYATAGCGEGGAGRTADAASTGSAPSASVSETVRGPIDAGMAARGEELFRERGCAACHRLEERLVGPPLGDVASRREYGWFRHMVVNPDSMVRSDSTARAMLAEYMVPMPDQGVTDEEARALFEYFRREGAGDDRARAGDDDGGGG